MKTKLLGTYTAIQHGKRGQVVSIPSHFAQINGIEPGTPLNVYVVEGSSNTLLIQPWKPEKANGGR